MVNTKLIEYIKTEEAKGFTAHQLHDFLLKKGFKEDEIDAAIAYANKKDITTSEQQEGFANALTNIKRRSSLAAFFWTIITLGLYTVFWYMRSTAEMRAHQQKAPSPVHGLLLLFPYILLGILLSVGAHYIYVPLLGFIVGLVVYIPYVRSLTRLTKGNAGVLLTLMLLVLPFGVMSVQEELNSRAHYK